MTLTELSKILCVDFEGTSIYMPNEIFDDLRQCQQVRKGSKSNHIAFMYSFVYLITWLYRYTRYLENIELLKVGTLKQILTVSNSNKGVDYLIKNGGVLDQLGYTKTSNELPILWHYDKLQNDYLEFSMLSDYPDTEELIGFKNMRRTQIKIPLKSLEGRYLEVKELELSGIFYEVSDTHNIPLEVFLHCMAIEDLGVAAFYIYSFVKHQTDKFPHGYDCAIDDLVSYTGVKRSKLVNVLKNLEIYNMINNSHAPFVVGLPPGKHANSNTYKAKEYRHFFLQPRKTVPRQRKISYATYLKETEDLTKENPFRD